MNNIILMVYVLYKGLSYFLQELADMLREVAENDGKVNFVAVAQVLQVPAEVKCRNKER